MGEIDLILEDRGTLVFVEVRLRGNANFGGAAASITAHKQNKLVRAAQHYLQRQPTQPPCRFDAVLLDGGKMEWIRDAFGA
jgi:putative endonuclease